MSISGGALDSAREFLDRIVELETEEAYPYWDLDSGRWALAHWVGIKQDRLVLLRPDSPRSFIWQGRTLQVFKYLDREGVGVRLVKR